MSCYNFNGKPNPVDLELDFVRANKNISAINADICGLQAVDAFVENADIVNANVDNLVVNNLTITNPANISTSTFALGRSVFNVPIVGAANMIVGVNPPYQQTSTSLTASFNAVNGEFVFALGGFYRVDYFFMVENYGFTRAYVRLQVNGANYPTLTSLLFTQDASNGNTNMQGFNIVELNAGDGVRLHLYADSDLPAGLGPSATPNITEVSVVITRL